MKVFIGVANKIPSFETDIYFFTIILKRHVGLLSPSIKSKFHHIFEPNNIPLMIYEFPTECDSDMLLFDIFYEPKRDVFYSVGFPDLISYKSCRLIIKILPVENKI